MSNLLMSQPPRMPVALHAMKATAPAPIEPLLTLTAGGLGAKDVMVLRSLVRLLDNHHGLRLRFSEEIGICNVVFLGGSSDVVLPPQCVAVRVLDIFTPEAENDGSGAAALHVQTPLRASNVLPALEQAARRLAANQTAPVEEAPIAVGAPAARAEEAPTGQEALFRALGSALSRVAAQPVLLRFEGDVQVLVDPVHDHLHSEMPPALLLAGHHQLLASRVPSKEECIAFMRLPAVRLRRMVWLAAALLSEAQAPIAARPGRYRLLRWPDASVLVRPGHPRFAALLTSRPMSLEQLSAACEIDTLTIRWLLEASLAVGIAVRVDDGGQLDSRAPEDEHAPEPEPPPSRHSLDIFSRLRERLRLW